MFDWLMSNPLLIVLFSILAIVLIVLFFIFVKAPKGNKKNKKDEKKKDDKISEKSQDDSNQDESEIEQKIKVDIESINKKVSEVEEEDKKKNKTWKEKHKREVTRVFEPKKSQVVQEKDDRELDEREQAFMRNKQFVKTSKRISKISSVSEKYEDIIDENEILPEPEIEQTIEPETTKPTRKRYIRKPIDKSQYFDKTKRLSKSIEADDFDGMFKSHVSDDYLDIDIERHLNIGDSFSEKLFARTSKMLANSGVKVAIQGEEKEELSNTSIRNDKDFMKDWAENRRRDELARVMANEPVIKSDDEQDDEFEEDDINLDAKNLLVVDSVLHRKQNFRNKK